MVDFKIGTNVHVVIDSTSGSKGIEESWFTDPIIISLNPNRGARLILDFAFPESSVVEITRDGITWIPLNENIAVTGEQNRLIPVNDGDEINFRASIAVTLTYATFGDV